MDEESSVLQAGHARTALQLILSRRKRLASRRAVVLSGVAGTGKSTALQALPAQLALFTCLLVTVPQHATDPSRKASWRAFLQCILTAQGRRSIANNKQTLLEEVAGSLNAYDLLVIDQAERLSRQYIDDLCTLIRTSRWAFLLVGWKKWLKICSQ